MATSRTARWRGVAAAEVVLALAAVLLDLLLPALVLLALAGVSLLVRREGVDSLGVRRIEGPRRVVVQVFGLSVAWTVLTIGFTLPVLEHVTGERQDVSAFEDVEGDLGLLVVLLVLSWTLAAVGEEFAFRGYLHTRVAEAVGGPAAIPVAVLVASVAFGLIHTEQGIVGVLVTTIDGIWFSLLRLHYGTVWAAVLAHGFNNTIGLTTYFLVGPVSALW